MLQKQVTASELEFQLMPSDRWGSVDKPTIKAVWYEWCIRHKFKDHGIMTPLKHAFFLWDYVVLRYCLGNVRREDRVKIRKKRKRTDDDEQVGE